MWLLTPLAPHFRPAQVADRLESRRSTVAANERSPRWGEEFDFAAVSGASALEVALYNRCGRGSSDAHARAGAARC